MASLKRLPGAIFAVDVNREATAIKEANKLKIPVFGIVDSNASARLIDYPIPGNDDSFEAIRVLVEHLGKAIEEGNAIWEVEKAKQKSTKEVSASATKEKEGIRKKRTVRKVAQSEPVVAQENTDSPAAIQVAVKAKTTKATVATKEEATSDVEAKSFNTSPKTAETNAKEEEKAPEKQ
jgi:small subunit ribosomal protein S2